MKKIYSQPTIEIQAISYQSALCGSGNQSVTVNTEPISDEIIN